MPKNPYATRWFVIQSGEHVGKLHLSGWRLSAIMSADNSRTNPWIAIAHCPVCAALVVTDDKAYGDLSWEHEQWHARTDFPIPLELMQ